MNTKNDGGPAFPRAGSTGTWEQHQSLCESGFANTKQDGMSLRAYFAGQAMQGICASSPGNEWTDERIAKDAVALADALIAELNKP